MVSDDTIGLPLSEQQRILSDERPGLIRHQMNCPNGSPMSAHLAQQQHAPIPFASWKSGLAVDDEVELRFGELSLAVVERDHYHAVFIAPDSASQGTQRP